MGLLVCARASSSVGLSVGSSAGFRRRLADEEELEWQERAGLSSLYTQKSPHLTRPSQYTILTGPDIPVLSALQKDCTTSESYEAATLEGGRIIAALHDATVGGNN